MAFSGSDSNGGGGYGDHPILPRFYGGPTEDPDEHLRLFKRVMKNRMKSSERKMLKHFPLSLQGEAEVWFDSLGDPSSLDWSVLCTAVLAQFRSKTFIDDCKEELSCIYQRDKEDITEYVERVRSLVQKLGIAGTPKKMEKAKARFIRGLRDEFYTKKMEDEALDLNAVIALAHERRKPRNRSRNDKWRRDRSRSESPEIPPPVQAPAVSAKRHERNLRNDDPVGINLQVLKELAEVRASLQKIEMEKAELINNLSAQTAAKPREPCKKCGAPEHTTGYCLKVCTYCGGGGHLEWRCSKAPPREKPLGSVKKNPKPPPMHPWGGPLTSVPESDEQGKGKQQQHSVKLVMKHVWPLSQMNDVRGNPHLMRMPRERAMPRRRRPWNLPKSR